MVNKDQKGNPATPEEFKILLVVAKDKFYAANYKEMLMLSNEKGTPLSEIIFTNNKLKRYIKKQLVAFYQTTFPLPTDFNHELSATCQMGSRPLTKMRKVTLGSPVKYDRDITNDLRDEFNEDVIGLVRMELSAIELSSEWDYLSLSYLRKAIDPVFDYCFDQLGNVYYMPPTYQIKTVGGVENLYNGSTLVASDVEHPTATVFPYTSVSVEMDVDVEYHDDVAKLIIIDMSIRDREFNVTQAEIQKQ
jgi:hypothetical protein